MRLILARHGETGYNRKRMMQPSDKPVLTGLGIKQSKKLAEYLSHEGIDVIFCSPATRARQTLEHIREKVDVPVFFEPLVEERNPGAWAGKPVDDFIACRRSQNLKSYEFKPEGGESLGDVRRRARLFWEKVRGRHADETVLLVSHSRFNGLFMGFLLGMPLEQSSETGKQSNCAVHELLISEGKAHALKNNYDGFLGPLASPATDSADDN
jgi:probable phosphoglycerate mutase